MKDTILQVNGMTCPSCVRHVDGALRELDGVTKVDVRLREGIVHVQHDPSSAPPSALIAALRAAGYDSRPYAA
jgi:copper chaperone